MKLFPSLLAMLSVSAVVTQVASNFTHHCDPMMPFNTTVTISSDRNSTPSCTLTAQSGTKTERLAATLNLGNAAIASNVYLGLYNGTGFENEFAFVPGNLLPLVPGNVTAIVGFYTLG